MTRRTSKIIPKELLFDWITQSSELLAFAAHQRNAKHQTADNTVRRHGALQPRRNQTATNRIGGWRMISWLGLQRENACAALLRVIVTSRNNRRFAGPRRWGRDESRHT